MLRTFPQPGHSCHSLPAVRQDAALRLFTHEQICGVGVGVLVGVGVGVLVGVGVGVLVGVGTGVLVGVGTGVLVGVGTGVLVGVGVGTGDSKLLFIDIFNLLFDNVKLKFVYIIS